MIETSDLKFSYPSGPDFSFPKISCGENDVLLIIGNSGCGKTTLLHILAGLLKADSGSIKVGNTDLQSLSGKNMDKFRGENIGIVFQTGHFVQSLNVMDNLILPQFLAGKKIDKKKAKDILNRLNIGGKEYKKPRNLSVGEQQRMTIARAVMNDPKLILADEPTSALDDQNAEQVIELLKDVAKECGAALIIVTHDSRLKDRFKNVVEL